MSLRDSSTIADTLQRVLGEHEINQLGVDTGQSQRLRVVTPFRLSTTLIGALGNGTVETIADLCREFNYLHGTTTAYKAFYNRLARPGFVSFTQGLVKRLIAGLAVDIIAPDPGSPVARFDDVVIQDGSSFAVKATLRGVFPGRFKTIEPAAVEVHATYSGFRDEVASVSVAPDTQHERAYLPEAADLTGKLFLADRGYPSRRYFQQLDEAGASFVVRLSRSYKPYVCAVHGAEGAVVLPEPVQLPKFLDGRVDGPLDLDIEFCKGKQRFRCRMVILPGKKSAGARLCTNLPRSEFPIELVGRLYRFRWQIELLFKEWKSYANLRKFDTSNKHIAEGLIWASLAAAVVKRFLAHATQLAAGEPISTRKVAMCAHLFLRHVLQALPRARRLRMVVRQAIRFLASNARRSHPRRDQKVGRQASGFTLRLAS